MIFENKQERKAYKFIVELVKKYSENKICNDLTEEEKEWFSDMYVFRFDNDFDGYKDNIKFEDDIIMWLEIQQHKNINYYYE